MGRGKEGGQGNKAQRYPHMLAVGGPHGRFEHLLAHGTVEIILVEALRGRLPSHGEAPGPRSALWGGPGASTPRPPAAPPAGPPEDGGRAPGARWAAAERERERGRGRGRARHGPGPAREAPPPPPPPLSARCPPPGRAAPRRCSRRPRPLRAACGRLSRGSPGRAPRCAQAPLPPPPPPPPRLRPGDRGGTGAWGGPGFPWRSPPGPAGLL